MQENQRKLLKKLKTKLGDYTSKNTKNGLLYAFPCPFCKKRTGIEPNKKKLTVRFDNSKGVVWKCWVADCQTVGKGTKRLLGYEADSKLKLNVLNLTKLIILNLIDKNRVLVKPIESLPLPKDFKPLLRNDLKLYDRNNFSQQCLLYMTKRGIAKLKMVMYNIGYSQWLNRLIFPSYDLSHNVNFWTSRRINGNRPWKHAKGNIDNIIFNLFFVNWDLPVILVLGVFDWLNVYNSIPLLGGSLNKKSILYKTLRNRRPRIILRLDNDAKRGTNKIINLLINIGLPIYIMRFKKKDLGLYNGSLKFKITKDFQFVSKNLEVYVLKIDNHLKILTLSL